MMSEGMGRNISGSENIICKGNDFSIFQEQKESGTKISWVGLKKLAGTRPS